MKASWVDVLLDPASVAQSRVQTDDENQLALALLFQGRAADYEKKAPDLGLPTLQEPLAATSDAPLAILVQSVVRLLNSDVGAITELKRLIAIEDCPSDLRAIAAVLVGMAMRDAGQPQAAVALLKDTIGKSRGSLERGLLMVHLSLAHAELGDFASATQVSLRASGLPGRGSTLDAIRAAAAENVQHFQWALGIRPDRSWPKAPWPLSAFAWVNAITAEAGSKAIDRAYDSEFENPFQRTWNWSSRDEVGDDLAQAVFRLECLGAWSRIRSARKRFARYQLSRAHIQGGGFTQAIMLLSRSGDEDGVRKAAVSLRLGGPLEQLRDAGRATAYVTWTAYDIKSRLELLVEAASALDQQSAAFAVDRLLDSLPSLLGRVPGAGIVADRALLALAELVRAAGPDYQDRVARTFLDLAVEPPDPLLHQSLARAIERTDWRGASRETRRRWRGYVSDHLAVTDDHVFVAIAAAAALGEVGARGLTQTLTDTYRDTRSWLLVPLVLGKLGPEATRELNERIRQTAAALAEAAHRGSFTLPSPSPGALLGLAASSRSGVELRQSLVDFVLDPAIPIAERVAAATYIIRRPGLLDAGQRLQLAGGLPPPKMSMPILGTMAEMEIANLELRVALGQEDPGLLIAPLLQLAHSQNPEARAGAIGPARALYRRGVPEAAIVMEELTWDPAPLVASRAGRALASQLTSARAPRRWALRLDELLDQSGEVTPLLVWLGLTERASRKSRAVRHFRSRAELVAREHISVHVREAASEFLLQSAER